MNIAAPALSTAVKPQVVPGSHVWQQLLKATPALTRADAQALAALTTLRRLVAGDLAFALNSPVRGLIFLVEGCVAVGRGKGAVLAADRMCHGPAWLDAASAWAAAGRHAFDARAVDAVCMAEIPQAGLLDLLSRRPTLAPALLTVLAQEVQRLALQAHELLHKDAASRLAAWLHRQARDASAPLHLTERKRDIAAQLGMSPETLSRQMRQLSRRGLIEVRGYQVNVLDSAGLQHLASLKG